MSSGRKDRVKLAWPEMSVPFHPRTAEQTSRHRPVKRAAIERKVAPIATTPPPRETNLRSGTKFDPIPPTFTAREPGTHPDRTQAMRDRFNMDPALPRDNRFGTVEWRKS